MRDTPIFPTTHMTSEEAQQVLTEELTEFFLRHQAKGLVTSIDQVVEHLGQPPEITGADLSQWAEYLGELKALRARITQLSTQIASTQTAAPTTPSISGDLSGIEKPPEQPSEESTSVEAPSPT